MWTSIKRMDKQGPTVEHRGLYPIPCDRPEWKGIGKKSVCVCVCVCMYVSLNQQKLTQHCKSTILQKKSIGSCLELMITKQLFLNLSALCLFAFFVYF